MRVNHWKSISGAIAAVLAVFVSGGQAIAIPGQSVEEAIAWIQAHPTLRPAEGETLLIRKSDTPARRFTFQSMLLPPGAVTAITATESSARIRTERLTLVDLVRGVSPARLAETINIIYGAEIFADYQQAESRFVYQSAAGIGETPEAMTSISTLQGEFRRGDRFAYWWEVAYTAEGLPQSGQMTLLLLDDADSLEAELRDRWQPSQP